MGAGWTKPDLLGGTHQIAGHVPVASDDGSAGAAGADRSGGVAGGASGDFGWAPGLHADGQLEPDDDPEFPVGRRCTLSHASSITASVSFRRPGTGPHLETIGSVPVSNSRCEVVVANMIALNPNSKEKSPERLPGR